MNVVLQKKCFKKKKVSNSVNSNLNIYEQISLLPLKNIYIFLENPVWFQFHDITTYVGLVIFICLRLKQLKLEYDDIVIIELLIRISSEKTMIHNV